MQLCGAETYDCEATLADSQVLDFCKNGFLMLPAVVPDDINRKAVAFCDKYPSLEPIEFLAEEWFMQNVICNPAAVGAVRSLLGADFHLPVIVSNHRRECPLKDQGTWHVDGNSVYSHETNHLQVFYYPQDTPAEMGPTAVLPGSHLIQNRARFMTHLGGIRGAVLTSAPAGSIFITSYPIWHRSTSSTATGIRNLLKYFYWRTTPPQRDWIVEPGFDLATTNYGSPAARLTDQFRDDIKVAEIFLWLCGQHDAFQNLGGQSWPLSADRCGKPYGCPTAFGAAQETDHEGITSQGSLS